MDSIVYQVIATSLQYYQSGEQKLFEFRYRSLISHEKNYSVLQKKCLAVVWAIQTMRLYIQSEQFIVCSGQPSLRWLMEISEPDGYLMCWRMRLTELGSDVKNKKCLRKV